LGLIEDKERAIISLNNTRQSSGKNCMFYLSVNAAHGTPLADTYLSPIQVRQIERLVLKFVIEERRFLRQRYSLKALSEDSGIPVYLLSLFMNKHCHTSYSDFINKLRIDYCKEKILTGECGLKTLEALGMESGFNNRTTFTQCFKKFTGYTPSAFLQQSQSEAPLGESKVVISLPEGRVLTPALT
jgi:AraC-like DNA-binding protein